MMPFHRLSPLPIKLSLLLLLGLVGLASQSEAPGITSETTVSNLEEKAHQALQQIFGRDDFQLYLVTEQTFVISKTDDLEVGEAVLQSDQVKRESSGPSSRENGDGNAYKYEVESRNFVVGQSKVASCSSGLQTTSVRCVVVVKPESWSKVELARPLLLTLLGVESDRGDKLSFVKAP